MAGYVYDFADEEQAGDFAAFHSFGGEFLVSMPPALTSALSKPSVPSGEMGQAWLDIPAHDSWTNQSLAGTSQAHRTPR